MKPEPKPEPAQGPEIDWWYFLLVVVTIAIIMFGFVTLMSILSPLVRWVCCCLVTGLYLMWTSKPGDWKV